MSASTSAGASAVHRVNAAVSVQPTPEQQHVLERIAMQRERIHARRVAHAQSAALASSHGAGGELEESFALRAAGFAREHPLAVLGVVGLAAVAGPRRMIRWAGVLLPMLMRLRR